MTDILSQYHSLIESSIDAEGVNPPYAILEMPDGKIEMMALALTPDQAYRAFLSRIRELDAVKAIFALDRFTKEDQGTRLSDVMAGNYYEASEGTPFVDCFRPFIIEYQHEPRIVDPFVWDNAFWNAALTREVGKLA